MVEILYILAIALALIISLPSTPETYRNDDLSAVP
jgi:hypothetical protein